MTLVVDVAMQLRGLVFNSVAKHCVVADDVGAAIAGHNGGAEPPKFGDRAFDAADADVVTHFARA